MGVSPEISIDLDMKSTVSTRTGSVTVILRMGGTLRITGCPKSVWMIPEVLKKACASARPCSTVMVCMPPASPSPPPVPFELGLPPEKDVRVTALSRYWGGVWEGNTK